MYIVEYYDPSEDEYCTNYVDTLSMAEEFRDLMIKFGMKDVTLLVV
jgi:hypothetical protein